MKTNKEILNMIKEHASSDFNTYIDTENINVNMIFDNAQFRSEFLNILIDKITIQDIHSKQYDNKLGMFKYGYMPTGGSIENIFIEYAESKNLNENFGINEYESLFGSLKSNVKANIVSKNFKHKAKTSFNLYALKLAFNEEHGLFKFINKLSESIKSSLSIKEESNMITCIKNYLIQKDFTGSVRKGVNEVAYINCYPLNLNSSTGMRMGVTFAQSLKFGLGEMTTLNTKYNTAGVKTFTNKHDLVFITKPSVNAIANQDLSYALGSNDGLNENKIITNEIENAMLTIGGSNKKVNLYGLGLDKNSLKMIDIAYTAKIEINPDTLDTNLFIHHHGIVAMNMYGNLIAFVCGDPTTATGIPANDSVYMPKGLGYQPQ